MTLVDTKIKTLRGLTLIELIFVIILMAALATTGLALFRLYSEDFKINRTAEQIQQLLEAASSYYVDNGCWPDPNAQCQGPNNWTKFVSSYIPLTIPSNATKPVNPWNYPYQYQQDNDPNSVGTRYQVTTTVPNQNIAKLIIAKLPSGAIQNSNCNASTPCIILSETTTPALNQVNENNIILRSIGSYGIYLSG